jgi:hypothetical protein
MNINLTSEIIWSLAVTILIGLWLIWEALNIHPGIDILKISVNWFRDRPIILPSLLLLIFPFLLSGIIHNLPPNFNNLFDNKIIAQLLATFGAVISIYIANRALEKFKKTEEKKKIGKILIASMEAHLEYINKLTPYFCDNSFDKSTINKIERIINQIKKDYIYESALKSVGIFDSQEIDFIYRYARNIIFYLDEILAVFDNKDRFVSVTKLRISNVKLQVISMEAKLCIMILIKQIVQDNDRLKLYQKLIINEYAKHREKYNIYGYSPLEIQDIVKTTAILFEGYGLRLDQNLRQTQTNGDELDNYL